MKTYNLRYNQGNEIIFSGKYTSFIECLEDAVTKNVNLAYIDLEHKNLMNANLDNAHMPFANFKNANLTGANLSESNLSNAIFDDCSLYNTCFSYSDIQKATFLGASFGGTLIEGCNIRDSVFSTMSCFDLHFSLTRTMTGCRYIDMNYKHHDMSEPPIIIKGLLNSPVVMLDKTVQIGNRFFSLDDTIPSLNALIQRILPKAANKIYLKRMTGFRSGYEQ